MRYLMVLLLFVSACDPCANLDCDVSDFQGQFRIISATDSADLLFGPKKKYNPDSIRFYSLPNSDTTFFESKTIRFPNIGYDSILVVDFLPQTDTAYMWLPNGDIDTLQMNFKTIHSRCCGTLTKITNFRLNNTVDLPGQGTQTILK